MLVTLVVTTTTGAARAGETPAEFSQRLDALALAPEGLDLRIGHAGGAAGASRAPMGAATVLSDADVQKLLSRLPAEEEKVVATEGLVLRPASQPPPRTGETIRTTFPPPPSAAPPPPERAPQPLEVLRWMPEGDVGRAREVTVVFNQPMVPLTSPGEADSATVPVHLKPEPAGRWSWLDPKTVQFRPDVRFPHSTTYKVEIPAGTRSLAGTTLAEGKTFGFETPALRIESSYPSGSGTSPTTVPIVVVFNQKVDAAALLERVRVTAAGSSFSVRLLRDDELAAAEKADEALAHVLAEPRKAGHVSWILALGPRNGKEFPKDSAIQMEIAAGAGSLEGPNVTKAALGIFYRTYAPLRIVDASCYGRACETDDTFSVRFNNRLDESAFRTEQVRVSPDVGDLEVELNDSSISFAGSPQPRSIYDVRLLAKLKDVYGQTLGEDQVRPWRVGDAPPRFDGPRDLTVLEPTKKPALELLARGYERIRVRLYRVAPSDYDAYSSWHFDVDEKDWVDPPGAKFFDEIISPTDGGDQVATTKVDVAAGMNAKGFGNVVAVAYPEPLTNEAYPVAAWLQSTRLGLDAVVDEDGVVVFVTDLATGKPAAGVEVSAEASGVKAQSDANGVATLPIPASARAQGQSIIVARLGEDTAFIEWPDYYGFRDEQLRPRFAWYVFDDRGTYRPGEEVTLKGWIRSVEYRKNGDVAAAELESVSYTVFDAQHVRVAEGRANISANGSFDTRFRLPETPNLGSATIEFAASGIGTTRANGATHTHTIDVREFRRPEYQVVASVAEGTHTLGDSVDVLVRASYFAGGPLAQAPVSWKFTSKQAAFVPPGHEGYQFGVVPSWYSEYYGGEDDDYYDYYGRGETKSLTSSGETDSNGTQMVRLELPTARPAVPMTVSADAEVTDVNRQAWQGSTKMLVHPGDLYAGIRLSDSYAKRGTPVTVSVIGVDHEGHLVPGVGIEVTAARTETRWDSATSKYQKKLSDPRHCFVTSGPEPVVCSFDTTVTGTYTVTATIFDSKGRPSQSEDSFWVSSYETSPSLSIEQEKIELHSDRKEYAPGDTAKIGVELPFYPGDAIVTVRRSGVLETRHVRMTAPTTVDVAITEAMLPNVFVQVDAVGSVPRKAAKGSDRATRPAYATGQIGLAIPPKIRALDVRVEPALPSVAPAAETSLSVEVHDAAGQAVEGAEVAVFVVDEAVLMLKDHKPQNPMTAFYPKRIDGTFDLHSREYLRLESDVGGAYGEAMAPEEMPGAPPPLFLRKDFNPLAAFFPALVTDAEGRASAGFKLPDNVTRYRIFAIASSGVKRFGKGEGTLSAKLPLIVRPSAPRFLNFGDTFELPVVLQNQTSKDATVRVALRTQNLSLTAGAGREVRVPANDRVEVRFPAAASLAGQAAFQVAAESEAGSDAASIKLPVWTPATTEAFATYGVIDKGAVYQPVAVPGDVWPEFGGLDVTTSSTNLQSLTDAFLYLVRYPFDCGEQVASRMLAIVALQDVLTAFHAPDLPKPDELRAFLAKDVDELAKKQNDDGGFGFWSKLYPSNPYLSVHATNALARARARGVEVPDQVLDNAQRYIRDIETHISGSYSLPTRQVLSAFALYTRTLLGDVDVARARGLVEKAGGADKLPVEAAAWLLATLSKQDVPERKALERHLLNRVTETAGAAGFVTDYEDGVRLLLSSDSRTTAIALEALILADPGSDLIPRVVTGLLAHRKAGRWSNTQENVYVLLALDRYFRTYEKVEPDFVARLWLGEDYAGDHAFKGRTTESHEVTIPTREVAARTGKSLVIEKDGKGRLYYRAGMRFAPKSLDMSPVERGFTVERRYEGADDAADVTQDADGTWKIRLGARVRVRVQAFNEARRYQVALVDPLPAGLEPIAPKTSPGSTVVYGCYLMEDADFWLWWNPIWYEHQNLRDERAEAFTSLLAPGDHVYEYFARATTPGTFVVPPAKAEEMYMPETFGRSASTRVVIQ